GRAFLAHHAAISGTVARGTADAYAERLGVDLSRPVRSLSKGNKQKLGLIQAFQHSPELLVLDEPTSGLDPLVQREFHAMLGEARDRGATVFLSSHVLSEVQLTADRVAILREGRIMTVATVDALRESAVRQARITVSAADAAPLTSALQRLEGVTLGATTTSADRATVAATVDTHVDAFVKALAGVPLLDLTVEEPDLEAAVLRYYDGDARTPADAASAPAASAASTASADEARPSPAASSPTAGAGSSAGRSRSSPCWASTCRSTRRSPPAGSSKSCWRRCRPRSSTRSASRASHPGPATRRPPTSACSASRCPRS